MCSVSLTQPTLLCLFWEVCYLYAKKEYDWLEIVLFLCWDFVISTFSISQREPPKGINKVVCLSVCQAM